MVQSILQIVPPLLYGLTVASERAQHKAVKAGATAIATVVNRYENTVSPDDLTNDVFFGGRVTATSTGRPVASPATQEPS